MDGFVLTRRIEWGMTWFDIIVLESVIEENAWGQKLDPKSEFRPPKNGYISSPGYRTAKFFTYFNSLSRKVWFGATLDSLRAQGKKSIPDQSEFRAGYIGIGKSADPNFLTNFHVSPARRTYKRPEPSRHFQSRDPILITPNPAPFEDPIKTDFSLSVDLPV